MGAGSGVGEENSPRRQRLNRDLDDEKPWNVCGLDVPGRGPANVQHLRLLAEGTVLLW